MRHPLVLIILSHIREFYRSPSSLFWVYGFPVILSLILGTAFKPREPEPLRIAVVQTGDDTADRLAEEWGKKEFPTKLSFVVVPEADALKQLRTGKVSLVMYPDASAAGKVRLTWDERQANRQSVLARTVVEWQLQREANPNLPVPPLDQIPEESGGRYIDFLIPGLIGNNLMGGGMFGVGFYIVDLRVRKLLKRFLATPMRKTDFMLGIMLTRLMFVLIDVSVLLGIAHIPYFGVQVHGNWLALGVLILLAGACFTGMGLLVASRASTIETATGLMNAVMLSQWLLSGVFFSSDSFPQWLQPFIKILPLTAVNDGLRAIINDGAGFEALLWPLLVCGTWGGIGFFGAIKLFKWR